ncbi:Transketolase [bacterium HR19]|nr:Transketolase [bacterium HR19]
MELSLTAPQSTQEEERPESEKEILKLISTTIRIVCSEMVEFAKSGHPGAPLGLAEIATVLWGKILKINPKVPLWEDRDRFILSAGHASALLYTMLHLAGYDITKEDLKNFRKWKSKTPGHPEVDQKLGIETTTGPLGQGFGMGVGMAIAERKLRETFNRENYEIVNHFIYAIVSDGDIMEGISYESASIAGHLGLGRIIYLYDSNRTTIDGSTSLTFSEDVKKRFESLGWHTLEIDGHDIDAIEQAIKEAQKVEDKPSLIICHTIMAKGSIKKEGSSKAHGAPLGEEEVKMMREKFNWKLPPFEIPEEVKKFFEKRRKEWEKEYKKWETKFNEYRKKFPEMAELWDSFFKLKIPDDLEKFFPKYEKGKKIATRNASGDTIQILAEKIPNLIGGAADLAESVKTYIEKSPFLKKDSFQGQNIHFGVREHAMGAITNGIALHGGFIPFCGTFLIFSDYMRPAIRLAALMKNKVIFVFSHDSVFLGEDGPTHQPVEHLPSLRAIPNLVVIRPADANEVPYAWEIALREKRPVAIILTRQPVEVIDREKYAPPHLIKKGGYIIAGENIENPDMLIISSGSEVPLAIEVHEKLKEEGLLSKVVNLASWEIFEEQPEEYKENVIPKFEKIPFRVVIEAASSFGWAKYAGPYALYFCVDSFGHSAPYEVIKEKLGFTAEKIVEKIKTEIRKFKRA